MSKPHKEIWAPVCGYEGVYEVSTTGKVRSLDRTINQRGAQVNLKGIELVNILSNGYFNVSLWHLGKLKVMKVHRLVAQAFINNKENKPEVNHKDANRTNNNVENLEWVTREENVRHALKNNLLPRGENHVKHKLKDHEVEEIINSHGLTQQKLANIYKCSQGLISKIKLGKTKRSLSA